MTKSIKSLIAFASVSLFAAALAVSAAEGSDKKVESKVAGCCAKAAKAGDKCTHECCVAAAKEGMNCEKCKGSGPIQKKKKKKAESQ